MEKFNWRITFRINIFLLRILGLWPRGSETYGRNLYTLYATFAATFLMNCPVFLQIVNVFIVFPNLEKLSAAIFITIIEFLSIIKVFYFVRNMRMFKKFLIILNNDRFQPKTLKQKNFLQSNLNYFWKITYCGLWISSNIVLFLWSIIPILNNSEERRLPVSVWYPFDPIIDPFYQITYLYQILSIYFVALVTLNIDALITALMMCIGVQCDILCDDLRNLNSTDFNKKLVDCIKHHKEILNFADHCNRFCNIIVMGQFFANGGSIAITLFRLILVEPFNSEFYSLLFYVGAASFELFLYCWFGNEVEVKSSKILYAAFESNWTEAPLATKKNMIILTMKSRKPIKMSSFNVFYLSLDTYVQVLRASWSYFALLNKINVPK
ncbi:7tm 6 domain containing protein [Asbolus verrucosus]|uniref:Odorant receptor n=1 Tax=Asbolus verrucosus TaxID=1661398 RepID=A0A482VCV9_ASBVE|nr:7tm 6 domain containing protein [Asbolus verrucosus]